jgi:hypothetical protein
LEKFVGVRDQQAAPFPYPVAVAIFQLCCLRRRNVAHPRSSLMQAIPSRRPSTPKIKKHLLSTPISFKENKDNAKTKAL